MARQVPGKACFQDLSENPSPLSYNTYCEINIVQAGIIQKLKIIPQWTADNSENIRREKLEIYLIRQYNFYYFKIKLTVKEKNK